MMLSRSLPLAAALILASGAAVADEATDAQVRNVEVRKIVVGHGDGADVAKTGVFVSRIQTNGDDPVTSLQVLGSDAKAIEIDDIADGETRSFELGDGKWMDVTRDGEMLSLDLDGKEIQIPLNPAGHMSLPGLAGLGALGEKHVEVMMLTADDLHAHGEGPHGMMFISEDGAMQHLSGEGEFEWTEDGNTWTSDEGMAFGGMSKVIVKRIGHDGADGEDVQVMALPALAFGNMGGHPNLDELESLKDADPAVRAKVIEALHEILGKQHAVQLRVDVDAETDEDGKIRRVRRVAQPVKVEMR